MESDCLNVHALRKRWKPVKERLAVARGDHPISVRLHRAFSWLQFCEDLADQAVHLDYRLICQWIALNSLYSRWNTQMREPLPDRECWRRFFDQLLAIDAAGQLAQMLQRHRETVMSILDDEYLSSYFWEEPGGVRASKSKKAKYDARTWYLENRWSLLLERVIERVYLLRCQLIHGASTCGSSLNRTSLDRCIELMRHLLNAVLLILIDHGANEDWGVMCYPPISAPQNNLRN